MRQTCLRMVYELAKKDSRVFFIGSDLGKETLSQFKKEMPERFFMEGVCEQNLIGVAAGLALEGKIPFFNTIATFITRRCFEQNVLDLGLHKANVRLIGNGGGLVYAPLGPTHLAIEDIAIMRAIPNMTIVACADAKEMQRFMPQTLAWEGPIYIRLAKGHDPIVTHDDLPFEIGKAIVYQEGRDALIITTGITLKLGLEAARELKQEGIEAGLVHVPTIKPIDEATIADLASRVSAIVSIEEHKMSGGLGSAVLEMLSQEDLLRGRKFRRIGLPDAFIDKYGSQASLMQRYGITGENVKNTVVGMLAEKAVTEIHP